MRATDDGLLQSLHEGVFETPLWGEFLDRLLARTGARFTSLIFRPLEQEAEVELYAGQPPDDHIRRTFRNGEMRDPIRYHMMRPNRAYALDELLDETDPVHSAYQDQLLRPLGITAMRSIRVTEVSGVDLWLSCSGGKAINAATGALLMSLAPHLRIALRTYVELEKERFRSSVTGQVFDRLRMGWFTLDARCRVIEATDYVEHMFQLGSLLRRGRYDRLTPASPAIDRAMTALVKSYASREGEKPQAFVLEQDPWVDMLVTPVATANSSAGIRPAAIVYVRGDWRSQADRCDQLVDLFGLLPSEARLAWMLAQATSIGEAAEALGLSIETARNYSKKIYAKTGARGHADLVRIILTSVLAIS